MDITHILAELGVVNPLAVTPFLSDEDGEPYDVWRVETEEGTFVLKKTTSRETAVYETFLAAVPSVAPVLLRSQSRDGADYLMMTYVAGRNLRRCDRASLVAALDALITLQDAFWERRELQNVGYGFEESLPKRQMRGQYLKDEKLEAVYGAYLTQYATLPQTLCHDDLLPFNVLISEGGATLLDWEYGGILPYPTSLARLIAHGEEEENAFFYIKEEDKAFAIDYYYEKLIARKGIAYVDYRRTVDLFLFYETCEWVMLGNRYGNTDSERFRRYREKAKALADTCLGADH